MLSKGISLTRRLPTKPTVISACVGLFWMSLLLAAFNVGASAPTLQVGDIPPDAFGKSSTGDVIHLKDYRGRIVVISFWATWCGPWQRIADPGQFAKTGDEREAGSAFRE